MRTIRRIAAAIGMVVSSAWGAAAGDGKIGLVAAENFYGDVARQVGGARDLAAFENDLKEHKVRVLLYNRQVTDNLTKRLIELARSANIAAVGITETEPADMSFLDWMLSELDALEKALQSPPHEHH
jgi:ABC-type Zn uptake system ZnuABC Zn-binding protein ZnuA